MNPNGGGEKANFLRRLVRVAHASGSLISRQGMMMKREAINRPQIRSQQNKAIDLMNASSSRSMDIHQLAKNREVDIMMIGLPLGKVAI